MYNTSGWKDQLIRIDISSNIPCDNEDGYCWCTNSVFNSYNSIGHPTVHKGLYLSWSQGNKLTFYNGTSFTYASTGMRLTKGNNTTYEYEGDKLIKETRSGTTIEYLYGANGIIGFRYGGTNYYYIKNAFGDVTSVIDHVGRVYAEYVYDAFGNCTITYDPYGIGSLNPIRYRGYYYDTETGLYYLNSRYYDPEIGRFISPADTSTLNINTVGGLNLYAYAISNPVCIAYSNPNSGGMLSTIGGINKVLLDGTTATTKLSLPAIPWLVEYSTTIYGALSSLKTGFPIASHYYKYASFINDEFRLYGISKWKTSLQLSDAGLKMGKSDWALIGVSVLIDVYDSIQRGVSPEGVLLGGALTAASGVGMFYLSKGIMWASTTIGTAICPGIGTAIGFSIGLGISLYTDWKLGEFISDWIDSITS